MSFSVAALIVAVLAIFPNLIFIKYPPIGMPKEQQHGGILFNIFEQGGRIAYIIILIIFSRATDLKFDSLVFILMCACLLIYYLLWIRFFVKGRFYRYLYENLWFIPVPMAIFPVAYFILAALWLFNPFAIISAAIFGIGHIHNSLIQEKSEQL